METLKALALSGVGMLDVVHGGEVVGRGDLDSYCFLGLGDVGRSLGEAVVGFLASLNRAVRVRGVCGAEGDEVEAVVGQADVVLHALHPTGQTGSPLGHLTRERVAAWMRGDALLYLQGEAGGVLFQAAFCHPRAGSLVLRRHERGRADVVRSFHPLGAYGADPARCTRLSRGRASGLFGRVLRGDYAGLPPSLDPASAAVAGGLFAQALLGCLTRSEGFAGTVLAVEGACGYVEEWRPGL